MNKTIRIYNKFEYHLEDMLCSFCLYYAGKNKCKLEKCCCEDEKRDAATNGRIKRKPRAMRWDM